MMRNLGNFDHAILTQPIQCPKCHAEDLVGHAKPTLEREPDGSFTCTCCAHHFSLARPSLAYLATEKLIRKLADEKESS